MTTIELILARVVKAFQDVNGIDAVVLGGSRVTGSENERSDIDIGVYYDARRFDLTAFRERAAALDDARRKDAITNPGDWGPWINGGGWLTIDGIAVDILFRDTEKVIGVLDDCIRGKITVEYQCGHPFGFVNAIYMGEIAYCRILSSSNDRIQRQKARLIPFPLSYRDAAIKKFLWECSFSEQCGRKAVGKEDVLYAAGSLYRCAVCLLQVLYAVNEMYMLNEKGALVRLMKQKDAYIPDGFACDMETAVTDIQKDAISACFDRIRTQYGIIQAYTESKA